MRGYGGFNPTQPYQNTSHAPSETKASMTPPIKLALGKDLGFSAALFFVIAHQMRPTTAPQTPPAPNTIILKVHTACIPVGLLSIHPDNTTANKQTSKSTAVFLVTI
jgi:hypothetical protein